MATIAKRKALSWMLAMLALTVIVGCSPSGLDSSNPPPQTTPPSQVDSTSQTTPPSSSSQTADAIT